MKVLLTSSVVNSRRFCLFPLVSSHEAGVSRIFIFTTIQPEYHPTYNQTQTRAEARGWSRELSTFDFERLFKTRKRPYQRPAKPELAPNDSPLHSAKRASRSSENQSPPHPTPRQPGRPGGQLDSTHRLGWASTVNKFPRHRARRETQRQRIRGRQTEERGLRCVPWN